MKQKHSLGAFYAIRLENGSENNVRATIKHYEQSETVVRTSRILGSGSPGLLFSAMVLAHARPNTTRSSSELAPSLLAPCTETQADSPAPYRPRTILSWPFTCSTTYTANITIQATNYLVLTIHMLYHLHIKHHHTAHELSCLDHSHALSPTQQISSQSLFIFCWQAHVSSFQIKFCSPEFRGRANGQDCYQRVFLQAKLTSWCHSSSMSGSKHWQLYVTVGFNILLDTL